MRSGIMWYISYTGYLKKHTLSKKDLNESIKEDYSSKHWDQKYAKIQVLSYDEEVEGFSQQEFKQLWCDDNGMKCFIVATDTIWYANYYTDVLEEIKIQTEDEEDLYGFTSIDIYEVNEKNYELYGGLIDGSIFKVSIEMETNKRKLKQVSKAEIIITKQMLEH